MRNTLPKSSILRGYKAFSDTINNGVLLQGTLLHCYARISPSASENESCGATGAVKIGFAVPKKNVVRAVERNRVRRLMREAYRKNQHSLLEKAQIANRGIKLVLVFHGKSTSRNNLTLHAMEEAWNTILPKVQGLL